MSAQPSAIPSIAATIRGKAALDEVRDLLDRLAKVDADLDLFAIDPSDCAPFAVGGLTITHDELHAVIQRRRDAILNKLQNKGIRIAPDPEHAHALPPERAPADDSP